MPAPLVEVRDRGTALEKFFRSPGDGRRPRGAQIPNRPPYAFSRPRTRWKFGTPLTSTFWGSLRWSRVRVLRYRQKKRNGEVIEACWLADFSPRWVGSRTLSRMAKSRWGIESQGFNEAKKRHGMEHICHHETNSSLVKWLILVLGLINRMGPPRAPRRVPKREEGKLGASHAGARVYNPLVGYSNAEIRADSTGCPPWKCGAKGGRSLRDRRGLR